MKSATLMPIWQVTYNFFQATVPTFRWIFIILSILFVAKYGIPFTVISKELLNLVL